MSLITELKRRNVFRVGVAYETGLASCQSLGRGVT